MRNSLNNAKEEFKRCDHLLYVSLKYTRTVDVIKSLISRMISTYEFVIDALLKKKRVKDIPSQVGVKIDRARGLFADDPVVMVNLDNFIMLRKLDKVAYKVENEFRRHVHLLANVDGKDVAIGIDEMMAYYAKLKEFLESLDESL